MIDINNVPTVFNEAGRKPKFVGIDALKDIHVSFSGYGIADGETITFPTKEQLAANPNKYIKVLDTYPGSPNKGALVLVDRNGRTGWFNLSTLSRQAYDADGQRVDIDAFRTEMRGMNDDKERLESLLGCTIKGAGSVSLYARDFDRETRKPLATYSEFDYVQIERVAKAAPKGK